MPAFTKPSAGTLQTFETSIAGLKGVERRTMFGYPSVFLNGNMLACVFQDRIMLRLSDADRSEAIAAHKAKLFEPSPGRAMKEYIELPTAITKDQSAMQRWFERDGPTWRRCQQRSQRRNRILRPVIGLTGARCPPLVKKRVSNCGTFLTAI